jgi:hypothetical protein
MKSIVVTKRVLRCKFLKDGHEWKVVLMLSMPSISTPPTYYDSASKQHIYASIGIVCCAIRRSACGLMLEDRLVDMTQYS